jgi:hypothetical protein
MGEVEKKPNEIWKEKQDKAIGDILKVMKGYSLDECRYFCEQATKEIELAIRLSAIKTTFDRSCDLSVLDELLRERSLTRVNSHEWL